MKHANRIIAGLLCFVITLYSVSAPFVASAGVSDAFYYGTDTFIKWLSDSNSEPLGGFTLTDWASALFSSNKPQSYYTTPTSSVEDKNGNVTNYYRGGDTTNLQILDSYNHTFNSIHNVTNTNNYNANLQLENFLNNYTTNTNNYTYNTDYKSWYYDNTSNTYNYDASQTYYNTDNSQYYISIDNSTDEYYLVNVQYSPTFVTVNYEYNNINNNTSCGNVTNVYYYELSDGRNSAALTADDVLGLDLGYDVVNYEMITDDPYTLSLQHFDGDYTDSSSYGRTLYSVNRSTSFVDSGSFGKAVKLVSGSAAGVKIPNLSGNKNLTFDFRIYYDKIDSLGIYLGDTNLFQRIPEYLRRGYYDKYTDDGMIVSVLSDETSFYNFRSYSSEEIGYTKDLSSKFSSVHTPPVNALDFDVGSYSEKFGIYSFVGKPILDSQSIDVKWWSRGWERTDIGQYNYSFELDHERYSRYKWYPTEVISADFSYSSYANQWVSMRITIQDGKLYYFVNGDLVGSGKFTMPTADKFYIKSSGTVYLDELRITTGSMVYTDAYNPTSAPYDTNKVLALPADLSEDTVYVRHSTSVSAWRIGGVRPSNPFAGFVYIPMYEDNSGGQAQIYDGSNWVNVDAYIYDGSVTQNTKGYTFAPIGDSADIAINSGGSSGSGGASSCDHSWGMGEIIEPEYDEEGNLVADGYTAYTCEKCGEVYNDLDGSGPPDSEQDPSDEDTDSDGFLKWLGGKLGELFGAIADGFIALLEATLGKILDSLISLVTSAIEKLNQIVNLFGSFGTALGSLWSWLPSDLMLVLVAGVTLFIFLAVLKLIHR